MLITQYKRLYQEIKFLTVTVIRIFTIFFITKKKDNFNIECVFKMKVYSFVFKKY